MHCTALGKAVLAFLPPQRVRTILVRQGMARHTPRTIMAVSAMERELSRVRRQGYAVDDVEFEDGVRCVGAPIFDHRGTPIAAISVGVVDGVPCLDLNYEEDVKASVDMNVVMTAATRTGLPAGAARTNRTGTLASAAPAAPAAQWARKSRRLGTQF